MIDRSLLPFAWSLLVAALSFGCATRPERQAIVADVELIGNEELSTDDVLEDLATKESPRFAGLIRGLIYDYRVFNEHVLVRDLERVRRIYQAEGFFAVRVRAGRVYREDDQVSVEIVVEEGEPTLVRSISWKGDDALTPQERLEVAEAFREHIDLGERFREEQLQTAGERARTRLLNFGYADATLEPTALVDMPQHRVDLVVEMDAGKHAVFGPIRISGLGEIPEQPVRRALAITEGESFSQEAIDDAEQALLDLGVFASVEIEQDRDSEAREDGVVPLLVRVHPTSLRTLRLGAGFELDALRTDVHGAVGWSHENFFGQLREFSISARPGLVFYPTRLPSLAPVDRLLPEVTTELRLEQPGFLEARTRGFISVGYDIYPVLLKTSNTGDEPIVGYREFLGSVGVSRAFQKLRFAPRYGLQAGVPFTYEGELNRSAASVYISYVELLSVLDVRNDRVHPRRGAYLAMTTQFAGLGGDARDVRLEPDARAYVPLTSNMTWTSRLKFGALFPLNYETFAGGNSPSVEDTQIGYFRAFFSGGPNSNRGYPYRTVGPHGAVSFFNPEIVEAQQSEVCDAESPSYAPDRCTFPLGGQSLWEASTAVRVRVTGPFLASFFCDASDVSQEQLEYDFRRPHFSCGAGPRYMTPVGPIRLDVAYRIPGLQVLGKQERNEGRPGALLGLPVNVSFGIGEAY